MSDERYILPIPTPSPRNDALEAAIRGAPEDPGAYLVYADWLTTRGDPRGELIVVQHKLESAPDDEALHAREAQLLSENDFLGGVPPHAAGGYMTKGVVTVGWKRGFFDSMRVFNFTDWMDDEFPTKDVVTRLFHLPAAAALSTLKVGVLRWQSQSDDVPALLEIAASAPFAPTLRALHLGDVADIDIDNAHHTLGDLGAIARAFPGLEELTIWGSELSLSNLALPKLKTLKVQTCALSKESLAAITERAFPALEDLEIWFGSENYGCVCGVDDLRSLLEGSNLPKLRRLGLMNAEFTDAICAALPTAKILPRLASVDLGMGCMSDDGARAILANGARFSHLASLDVSDNFISESTCEALEELGPYVHAGNQKDAEDDYRYVTVAE